MAVRCRNTGGKHTCSSYAISCRHSGVDLLEINKISLGFKNKLMHIGEEGIIMMSPRRDKIVQKMVAPRDCLVSGLSEAFIK